MYTKTEMPEVLKVMYRMFLLHKAFVTERTIRYENIDRYDCIEELKIKSCDGEYTLEIRIFREDGRLAMDLMRHEPRDLVVGLDGELHFIV